MGDSKVVIQCAICVPVVLLTKEEQEQESAKFKAWYASFLDKHGEELERIRANE